MGFIVPSGKRLVLGKLGLDYIILRLTDNGRNVRRWRPLFVSLREHSATFLRGCVKRLFSPRFPRFPPRRPTCSGE